MLSEERRRALKKQSLEDLARLGEPQFTDTWFPYTSGEVGPYYVQSVAIEKDGDAYARAVSGLCELAEAILGRDGFDVISGGESRDWDFSNPVAYSLRKPHAKLYKNGKILGAAISGKRVLHVADLNNEGSSVRDFWYPIIRSNGGMLKQAIFFIDRMEEGIKVLRSLNLPCDSLAPLDEDAWQTLFSIGVIDREMYKSLAQRSEDRHEWARRALRDHPEVLGAMLESAEPDTAKRGWKILDTGYPEMKTELLELVRERGYRI